MTTLTPELRQAYHDAVQTLFAGTLQSTPDDINQEVVDDIDTMMIEISKCSKAFTELGFNLIYEATVQVAVGYVISKILDGLAANYAKDKINEKLKEVLMDWVNSLMGNNQFKACINVARVNWKSKVAIDLLGL